MTWKPHVTVAAVVEREGRFLMVEEAVRGQIMINQPAGHLESGESLVDAVVREALEETGWQVRPLGVVGIYQWRDPGLEDSVLRVCFAAAAEFEHEHASLDEGILRALWLTPAALRAMPDRLRSPLVLESLDDYLAGRRADLALLRRID